METKKLGSTGVDIPVIGMGTWNIAPPDEHAPVEIDDDALVEALRFGIDKGITHIDSAEMYGAGHAEELTGEAIRGVERSSLFIATKVEPEHYAYRDVFEAAEGSLERLGTGYIDLYQLHWPSRAAPIDETMQAMEELVERGTIRFIGVSNFSVRQLQQAQKALSRHRVACNQVKYNVLRRGIEKDLIPFAEKEGVTITAYSPFATGYLFDYSGEGVDTVRRLAEKHSRTPAQVYLNWLIARDPVITIPKAVQLEHLAENAGAAGWRMEPEDYKAISNAFPDRSS